MTSEWLQANAKFNVSINTDQTNQNVLTLSRDAQNFEKLFKVKLIDPGVLNSDDKVTVLMKAGLEYTGPPVPQPRPDPLSLTVSDGNYACGFQFLDLPSYARLGPYLPIEGAARRLFGNGSPTIMTEAASPSSVATWPRVFKVTIDLAQQMGICDSGLNGGHMVINQYSDTLDASTGLFLEAFRGDNVETYKINFIEVVVLHSAA